MPVLNSRLAQLAKNMGIDLILIIGCGCLSGILILLQCFFLARIVNQSFLAGQGLKELQPWLVCLLGIILLRAFIFWRGEVLAHRGAKRVKETLRQRLLEHLFALGPVYGRQKDTGDMLNTLVEGIEFLEVYFSRYLPALALGAIIPVGILLVVFPRDLLTGLIFLFTAPLIPIFMILIGNLADARANKQWHILGRMNSHFLDVLEGLPTLKLLQRSRTQKEVIARLNKQWQDTTMGVLQIAFVSAFFLEFIMTISTAMIAVALGLRLVYGTITFEPAFFLLLLAPEFYGPLRTLGIHYHDGISGVKAAESIFALLDTPLPQQHQGIKSIAASDINQGIKFRQVSFAYQGEQLVLDNVSFDIKPGEHVALVGASGAGKSTILQLLMGFIEPQNGEILVGKDLLTDYNLHSWRNQVVLVPQTPYLFHTTVRENIALGRPEATLEEIHQAAAMAGIHQLISTLPDGYETIIGRGGRNLSAGQIQRIAIARACLMNTPLVLMDEATSSLDAENEKLVQEALKRLISGRTAVVVAHRLSTLTMVDWIIVMEKTKIIEEGTHQELLARKGAYYQLLQAYRGVA